MMKRRVLTDMEACVEGVCVFVRGFTFSVTLTELLLD